MSEDDLYELKDEPWMLKRVFTGEDFIKPPTMNPNTIEKIIEQTGWVKGEPLEDLRGRLEKIGELVAPYYKVPAYKFTPAPPMDRRKMLFGGSETIEEKIDKLAEKFYTLRYEGESTAYVKTKSFMRSALTELAADLQAEKEKEVAELRAWKESALKVMPDFQKLGKLLGLPIGSDVSEQLVPAVEKLTKEVAELRKALEEKDAMSATIAQQDALLDEVKRVFGRVAKLPTGQLESPNQCAAVLEASDILTRLGGTANE